MDTRIEVVIHTDGSCYPNPNGHGGWAFIARHGPDRHARRYGYASAATNNMMELLAIIRSLEFIRITPHPLRIVSDSKYCVNSLNDYLPGWQMQGWRTGSGKPVQNLGLMKKASNLLEQHREQRIVAIEWVKGHVGVADNEIADGLAGRGRIDRTTNWDKERDANTRSKLKQEDYEL